VSAPEGVWQSVRALLRDRRDDPPLQPLERGGPLPASFAQERLWLLDRLQPGSSAYNLAVACRLAGALDVAALERSLSALLQRHEILRTTLAHAGGHLMQRIGAPPPAPLEIDDVGAPDVEGWAAAHADRPFELDRGPLFRARLARVGRHDHCLLLAQHHAVFDGWSFEIFMRELCALYGAATAGRPSPLRALGMQYADFAAWQRRRIAGGAAGSDLAYWRQRLAGELPALRLPVDRARASALPGRGASAEITLPAALGSALDALARREGVTLYMVLLAAWKTLLHRRAGDEDVIVGSPVAGRNRPALREMLGLLTNTLAVRTDLGGQPTFLDLLGRVRDAVSGALAHQELPFERVVEAVRAQRPSGEPLFRTVFALHNVPRSSWRWPGLESRAWSVQPGSAKLDLALTMQQREDGLGALLEYDAELFDAATASRMLSELATLLGGIADDPGRRLGALPLLEAAERRRQLARGTGTASSYPRDVSIHRLFEEQARRTPDATALAGEGERISYRQLDARANRLAHRLRKIRVGREALVGVCLARGPGLVVAQLAALKAGAAYVPVDPATPPARLSALLARVAAIVGEADAPVAGQRAPVVRVDDPSLAGEGDDDPDDDGAATRVAYVMFTSGSTGAPRGVCVPHRAVVRLVRGTGYARFAADDVFLQLAPAAFDAATFEIWGALLSGATLTLAPARVLSITELGAVIARHRVTTLWLTAALFERFVDGGGLAYLGTVRQLLTGGDVVSPPHAARLLREWPGCRLVNCYGPTENTTFTTTHLVERADTSADIAIGRPIANTQVYVLDARREPVPGGVVGELYAGGDGLARGYLDDPEATQARFVPSPFDDGEVLYRTGDLARWRADGRLAFVGRADEQVKIRGFRVEPAEVEAALRACDGVSAAAVGVEGSAAADRRLVAYVVATEPDSAVAAKLRGLLRARLPAYMVPSEIVLVPELGVTENGKRDRRATTERAPLAITPAAGDALERRLGALVRTRLRGPAIGRHDNLFDAGLDSLSALELGVAIEREIGRPFPLATLVQRATIAQLADEIRGAAAPAPLLASDVVRIRSGAGARPLFLVASGRGGMPEAMIYARLMSRLGPTETVLALLAPSQGRTAQEIAGRYVASIRRIQPRGPYRIGGQCIGGVAAYEVAQQLRAAGQEIELLLLIDAWCPSTLGTIHHWLISRPRSLARAGLEFLAAVHDRDPGAEPWPLELWRRAVPRRGGGRHIRALMRYRPAAWPGEVTIVASQESLRLGLCRAWGARAAGGLAVHTLPGDHESYFKRHYDESAEVLRTCLQDHGRRLGLA